MTSSELADWLSSHPGKGRGDSTRRFGTETGRPLRNRQELAPWECATLFPSAFWGGVRGGGDFLDSRILPIRPADPLVPA